MEHDVRIYLWSFRAGSKTYVLSWASNISFSRIFFPLYIRFSYAARHPSYVRVRTWVCAERIL